MIKKALCIFLLASFAYLPSIAMEKELQATEALQKNAAADKEIQASLTYFDEHGLLDVIAPFLGLKDASMVDYPVRIREASEKKGEALIKVLSKPQITQLATFCKAYDAPKIFSTDKAEGYSFLIDLLFWVQENKPLFTQKNSFDHLKIVFERERRDKSITIVAGDGDSAWPIAKCTLPQQVAEFFPFFNGILHPNFRGSQYKQLKLEGEFQQSTLSLIKRILFIMYQYYRGNPSDNPHKEIDGFLAGFLSRYIESESQETEIALSEELLSFAHHFDIKVLMHAIIRVFEKLIKTDNEKEELVKSLPLDYFPALCGSEYTDSFVISLLGKKLAQLSVCDDPVKIRIPEVVSYCKTSFMNTIEDAIEKMLYVEENLRHLPASLEKKLKKKFIKKFNIPNFVHVWRMGSGDIDLPFKRERPVSAKRIDRYSVAFIDGQIIVMIYSPPSGTSGVAQLNRAYFAQPNINDRRCTHCAVFENAHQVAGAFESGDIEIQRKDRALTLIPASKGKGKIRALAKGSSNLELIVAYDSGLLEILNMNTGEQTLQLEPAQSGPSPYAYIFDFYCGFYCCAFTDGSIKLYDSKKKGLLAHTIKIPQLMAAKELITCCKLDLDMLIVCTKTGCIYCIDWEQTGTILRVLEAPKKYGSARFCSRLIENYIAVAYEDGKVCIWDVVQGKIIKTIMRKDSAAKPLCLKFSEDGCLEIIYDNVVIDHHLIPEVAPLECLINHMKHPEQLAKTYDV